ncbi:MAG: hypothetical protein KY444_07295 [Gemmatimonadetes bacterium]|nr:hypothetical protein [Gemmatimonadota bacterium]
MDTIRGVVAAGWCLAAVVVSYRNISRLLEERRANRDMAAHDPYGDDDRKRR